MLKKDTKWEILHDPQIRILIKHPWRMTRQAESEGQIAHAHWIKQADESETHQARQT